MYIVYNKYNTNLKYTLLVVILHYTNTN